MTWVKKSDDWPRQPQFAFAELEPEDESLYDRLLAYACEKLTDGHIPVALVGMLAHPNHRGEALQASVERLLAINPVTGRSLLERTTVGFLIVDFFPEQISREKALQDRAQTAERQRQFRERKAQSNAVTSPVTHASRNAVTNDVPNPEPRTPLTPVQMHSVVTSPPRGHARRRDPREYPVSGLDERLSPGSEPVPLRDLAAEALARIPGREAASA